MLKLLLGFGIGWFAHTYRDVIAAGIRDLWHKAQGFMVVGFVLLTLAVPAHAGSIDMDTAGVIWEWLILVLTVFVGGVIWWRVRRHEMKRKSSGVRSPLDSVLDNSTTRMVGDRLYKFSSTRTDVCQYYTSGGHYDGTRVESGYYNDPFWRTPRRSSTSSLFSNGAGAV